MQAAALAPCMLVAAAVCLAVRTITVVEVCRLIEGVEGAEVSVANVVDHLVKHNIDVCMQQRQAGSRPAQQGSVCLHLCHLRLRAAAVL